MSFQLFTYQIIKNKWIFVLFKIFLLFLIIFFNTQCAPKLEELSSLPDESFVEFFFFNGLLAFKYLIIWFKVKMLLKIIWKNKQ